ncbi:MAG: hypothetical protein AB7S26_37810 [Sandaracinaceae bacterium]
MSVEDVAKEIQRVDKALRDGKKLPAGELSINLTTLYRRYSWGRGSSASPLGNDAQAKLQLADRAGDARWRAHFQRGGKQIGVYRSLIGYYWILRYESMLGEHYLDHAGTAADLEAKYGGG